MVFTLEINLKINYLYEVNRICMHQSKQYC
jgi:hypothetical protein